ncbi:MAG: phosphoribosyltransferase [Cumulibacter sp.]
MSEKIRLQEGVEDYIGRREIDNRIAQLGEEISKHYLDLFGNEAKKVHVVSLAQGGDFFGVPLVQAMYDGGVSSLWSSIRVSQPHAGTSEAGAVVVRDNLDFNPKGEHILVVDDVLDSGKTLAKLTSSIRNSSPASLAIAALTEKVGALHDEITIDADKTFIGFRVANRFLVGRGMDYQPYPEEPGLYRELPHITVAVPDESGFFVPLVTKEPIALNI